MAYHKAAGHERYERLRRRGKVDEAAHGLGGRRAIADHAKKPLKEWRREQSNETAVKIRSGYMRNECR